MFKSWAVTKGPSLDPKDKRLAVETEDHPLDYGDFEGTIPKGEYGGGTVMLWDRGFWTSEGDAAKSLRKVELRFTLAGEKLQGSWVVVRLRHDRERGKRTNWLLIKRHDGYERDGDADRVLKEDHSVASNRSMEDIAAGKGRRPKPFMLGKSNAHRPDAVWHSHREKSPNGPAKPSSARAKGSRRAASPIPSFIPPQLCKRVGRPPSASDWVHEIKLDGYRMQLRIEAGNAVMRTRKRLDWTERFARVAEAGRRLADCIIDGEVVALDHNGAPDFAALQAALSEGRPQTDSCHLRIRQQEILAELGVSALRGTAFEPLLNETVRMVAEGLEAELAKVLEYIPAEKRLLMRAGVGWHAGLVGTATIGADLESPAGFALSTGKPVISNHLENEERFRTPELLSSHSVRRAMNVILEGDGTPYGILEVDNRSEGEFTEHDISFLQGAANILGMAIERQRQERKLKEALEHQLVLVKEINHRVKNSLQLVSSMLNLQAGADPVVAERLHDASSRIAAISRAHDRLYRSPQIAKIDLAEYLAAVCGDLNEVTPHCNVVCDAPSS